MKKLSINTKDGIKTIKCFEFDGLYESFKTIWNVIHNQMMLIALKYKEKYEPNCILEMWLCKEIDAAWEQALLKDGWSKEAINRHDKIEDFCIDNLFILTEDILNERIIFKKLCIDNDSNSSYLLIDPDNVIDGLYVSEIDFIDDFFFE